MIDDMMNQIEDSEDDDEELSDISKGGSEIDKSEFQIVTQLS